MIGALSQDAVSFAHNDRDAMLGVSSTSWAQQQEERPTVAAARQGVDG